MSQDISLKTAGPKVTVPAKVRALADYKDKPYFENLDSLRFYSFLVVFLFHVRLYEWAVGYTQNNFLLGIIRVLCAGGWGVTFFFTLSGFLITWLMLIEKEKRGGINIKLFYLRRVMRIWPLYYFVFFIGVVALPFAYKAMGQKFFFDYNVLLYGTFLSNYGALALNKAYDSIRSYSLIMNISWSVSIEEQFYLVWPLLFSLKKKYIKYISPVFIVFSIAAAIYFHNDRPWVYSGTLTCLGQLAVGGLLAYTTYYHKGVFEFFHNLSKPFIAGIYLAAFLVIYFSFRWEINPVSMHLMHLLGAFIFGMIILEQNFSAHSFVKFGRFKLASYFGRISYGLYMLHPIAMFVASFLLQKAMHAATPVVSGIGYIALSFVLSVAIAMLSYRLLEQPFLKLKKRFENKS